MPRITRVRIYRDPKTGRFTSRKRGAKVEEYTQRRAASGRIITAIEVTTERTVTKTVSPQLLAMTEGHIGYALGATNALSPRTLRGAKSVEIRIRGKDHRGKIHRFAVQIVPEKEKSLNSLMIGRIVEKLHEQRFRPAYPLGIVEWRRAKTSRSYSGKMRQLYGMEIIVKVRR